MACQESHRQSQSKLRPHQISHPGFTPHSRSPGSEAEEVRAVEMIGYELMFHPRCERVSSRTEGYDCVNNATVRELKGGDPRTDHSRKGTTRTPGWHPEEAAS